MVDDRPPDCARGQIAVALQIIDALDAQAAPISAGLRAYAGRQNGCRALMKHYGVGPLTAVTILAELGDARGLSSSRHAVRYAGLDMTVYQSDQHRAPGHLSRQGPPALRWALYEAVQTTRRTGSPDHAYYQQTSERIAATRRAWRWLASCSSAATTRCESLARRPCNRPENTVRAPPSRTPMHRGRLPACSCHHRATWTAQKDRAAAPHLQARSPY